MLDHSQVEGIHCVSDKSGITFIFLMFKVHNITTPFEIASSIEKHDELASNFVYKDIDLFLHCISFFRV